MARHTPYRTFLDAGILTLLRPLGGRSADDVWVYDLARGTMSRSTFSPEYDITPAWTPDGSYLAFASQRGGERFNLYRKRTDGLGEAERLTESANMHLLGDWSPDGR